MHAWNWQDICRPKAEGGMGIRRINDINNASGIRLVSRLSAVDSLWSRWMKLKYLNGMHLSQSTCASTDSGSWKWICNVKSQALNKLGN